MWNGLYQLHCLHSRRSASFTAAVLNFSNIKTLDNPLKNESLAGEHPIEDILFHLRRRLIFVTLSTCFRSFIVATRREIPYPI